MVSVSCLEVVFCESDVCFEVLLSLRVTVALWITGDCGQFPLSDHAIFCRQS